MVTSPRLCRTAVLPVVALLVASCSAEVDSNAASALTTPSPPPATSPPSDSTTPFESTMPTSTPTPSPAAPSEGWEAVVDDIGRGVARIRTTSCGAASTGSGALVADRFVLTAAHVVDGVSAVTVDVAGSVREADVIGVAPDLELGLLRLEDPVDAPVLALADEGARLGESVAVLGFPLGRTELTFTQGAVSSLDVPVEYEDGYGNDAMIQTDAAVNPGNSGGPLVDSDGRVVGVVSGKRIWTRGDGSADDASAEGTAYAVPAAVADQTIGEWLEQDGVVPLDDCGEVEAPVPDGVDPSIELDVVSDDADAASIAQVLLLQGTGINSGEYESAFLFFTDDQQEELEGLETWSAGLASTYWRAISLDDVEHDGASATARVRLRTEQAPEDGPDGQTCSEWVMDYEMQRADGLWLVDRVRALEPPEPC